MIGFVSALVLLVGSAHRADPCATALPRGPAVPAPIVLSTDCGWFRLETDGAVIRLPIDWLAKQNRTWRQRHGGRLTVKRTGAGRYLVVRRGRVIWRSTGLYYNEAGSIAFGPHSFAFDSYGRRGVFLTDLRSPERLVLHGRGLYPIGFSNRGDLLVSGRRVITAVSHAGTVLRRYPFRRASSFAFDEQAKTLYFVSPDSVLSAAHGRAVRRIRKVRVRGSIGLLGRRLLTFTGQRHVAVLRRDGSFVAGAGWHGARRELDAGVATTDDGKVFAFRVSRARPGADRSTATVYVLRARQARTRVVYRHRLDQAGCGSGASLDWHGSSLLYRSVDGTGVAEAAVLTLGRSPTRLTPLLRALPRLSPAAPGNAFWATGFS
jgi:hypothetical protein